MSSGLVTSLTLSVSEELDILGMKIYVNQIPEAGLQNHAFYDPRSLDMDRIDIHLREPFEVDAFVSKLDRELVVTAQIHCTLSLCCARCLEEFSLTVTKSAIFSYAVGPADVVDITEDVRQEILLTYPIVPLCRFDCKGLCITCGQNLNVVLCIHHQESPDG